MKFAMFNLGANSSRRESSTKGRKTPKTSGSRERDLKKMPIKGGMDLNVAKGMMDEIDGKKADKYWERMKEQQQDSDMTYVDADAADEYWRRLKSGCFDESESQQDVPIEITFSLVAR
jgi:hypothetical protein